MAVTNVNDTHNAGTCHAADIAAICLALAVALVYLPVRNYDFIRYDDEKYVTENPKVLGGLTVEGLLWAFKTTEIGFWQPLSWLSHMADVSIFGLNAGAHHLVNVLFHAINTVILFTAISALTGAVWRSAFVAALFALHPVHVESVAWIAERKDMLVGLFWALALWAYAHYVRGPSTRRYIPVLLCFVLGLMSKPTMMTLPLVLLLLDYWPLDRFSKTGGKAGALFVEKLPLLILSGLSGLITYVTETGGRDIHAAALHDRLVNAVISYARYVWKMIYPVKLSLIYPIDVNVTFWHVAFGALALLGVSALSLLMMRRCPYLFTGWFWFLLVMLPSIGIVSFGAMEFQAMADRYTYVPYVGLFLAMATAVPGKWLNTQAKRNATAAAAIVIVILCMALSSRQLRHWSDTVTVFRHAVDVTERNYVAYNNLGTALALKGMDNDSYAAFEKAIHISPSYKTAYVNLGNVLLQRHKPEDAIRYYEKAVSIDERLPGAYLGIGVALLSMGKKDEAAAYLKKTLSLEPNNRTAERYLNDALH